MMMASMSIPGLEPRAMNTEPADERHPDLDRYDTARLVAAFVDDQQGAALGVKVAAADLARAVDAAVPRVAAVFCLRGGWGRCAAA